MLCYVIGSQQLTAPSSAAPQLPCRPPWGLWIRPRTDVDPPLAAGISVERKVWVGCCRQVVCVCACACACVCVVCVWTQIVKKDQVKQVLREKQVLHAARFPFIASMIYSFKVYTIHNRWLAHLLNRCMCHPPTARNYRLRNRPHNTQLHTVPDLISRMTDCNFTVRMWLYHNMY